LFRDDVLILDAVESRFVTYGADLGPRIQVSFPDTPYLGFWSKPQAGFLCIEPWHGVADPQGYTGDFAHKPGIFVVKSNEAKSLRMAITLLS
jgi:galactose mutarotase-like enzyme